MPFRRPIAALGIALSAAGLAYSLWQGAVLALAWPGDASSIAKAQRLDPSNAAIAFRLARVSVMPKWLGDALQANPRLTAARIERALALEQSGDPTAAESDLLAAAGADHTQLPAWSLANFYLRQRDPARFWEWARRSAAIPGSDRGGIYLLAWRLEPDAAMLRKRIVPDEPDARLQFLAFLLKQAPAANAAALVPQLVQAAGPMDERALLDTTDHFLNAGLTIPAAAAWNRLALVAPHRAAALDPTSGPWLTNPDFRRPSLFRGFDWRFHTVEGVSFARDPARGELSIELSGHQPETTPLIDEFLPLGAGRYRFSWRAAAGAIPQDSLVWTVGRRAPTVASASLSLSSLEVQIGETAAVRLVLSYRRRPGSPRAAGILRLRALCWERLP